MSRKRAASPLPEDRLEASACALLQVIFDDALRTMRNQSYHPDVRLAAQRLVVNVIEWDAGTETIAYGSDAVRDAKDKIRLNG